MAVNSYFFNAVLDGGVYDRIYNAEDVTSYLDKIVGNGVFPNPSTQLQVRAGSGMQVIVSAGSGWIDGHKMVNTADLTLSIIASDVVLDRIDAVIFYVDYTSRTMGITVKAGTAASAPVAPTMTRSGTRYEMCLAHVYVAKQTSAITAAMITDTRGNSSICGFVQGLIQQIDTSTLWTQQQAQFDAWLASVQSQFEAVKAFKKLEGIYTTQTDGEASFNVATYVPAYSYVYDILEVYINGLHLTGNDYSLVNGAVVLNVPIEKAGAVVDFVVYKAYDPDA